MCQAVLHTHVNRRKLAVKLRPHWETFNSWIHYIHDMQHYLEEIVVCCRWHVSNTSEWDKLDLFVCFSPVWIIAVYVHISEIAYIYMNLYEIQWANQLASGLSTWKCTVVLTDCTYMPISLLHECYVSLI